MRSNFTLKQSVIYNAAGVAGFYSASFVMIAADKLMTFTPFQSGTSSYKIARGLITLLAGNFLIGWATSNRGFGIIPAGLMEDTVVAAFVGAWGPSTLLPIAKSLGVPLANMGDFEKFQNALLTGDGIVTESEMSGIRKALANGLKEAGRSDAQISEFNNVPLAEIASALETALGEVWSDNQTSGS